MILSKSKRFIFLKTSKTGGSSVEFFLSQFCNKDNDIITKLLKDEEELKKRFKFPLGKNIKYRFFSLSLKNLLKMKIIKERFFYDHMSLKELIKSKIIKDMKSYYIFCFVRNPFDWIVSYFWWYLFFHDGKIISKIKNFDRQKKKIFKDFLKSNCSNFFKWNKNIIYSDIHKVNIFKYEELSTSISTIKKKLSLTNEKIKLDGIKLKKLNSSQKITLDKEDIKLITKSANYFFEKFGYSKTVPKKYL